MTKIMALLFVLQLVILSQVNAQISILHSFDTPYGTHPDGTLVSDGTYLYGMTEYGGAQSYGTIFRVNKDGSGFTLLHTFNATDGYGRKGSLITDGSYLYGMCLYGGVSNNGIIFKIGNDGSGFQLLRSFSIYDNDGGQPEGFGSLLLDGTFLYGMTQAGSNGDNTKGIIFRIGTDGNDFLVLHGFHNSRTYYYGPVASLITDGTYLYGMTPYEGTYDAGTIFRIDKDGSNF